MNQETETQKIDFTKTNLRKKAKLFTFLPTRGLALDFGLLEGQSGLFIFIKTGSVRNVEGPDETKNTQQNPPKEVVAQAKWKPCSFSAHSIINKSHGWA